MLIIHRFKKISFGNIDVFLYAKDTYILTKQKSDDDTDVHRYIRTVKKRVLKTNQPASPQLLKFFGNQREKR